MPYDKILELVEAKQLDITTVSLAEITSDFIAYTQKLKAENKLQAQELANFLVVASQLLLIKSKVLLPSLELSEEEEKDIKELEERLNLYKLFKIAAGHLESLLKKHCSFYSRPFLMTNGRREDLFVPPAKLTLSQLQASVRKIANQIQEQKITRKDVNFKIISVESKIKELLQRIADGAAKTFSQIASAKSRAEVIASFLAVLHLLRDKIIDAEQKEMFGEIIIRKQKV